MSLLSNKTVLVTGATGLIGSSLTMKLMEEGANVIVVGRSAEKLKRVFARFVGSPNFTCCECNIANGLPEITERIDYIFHAASPISGAEIKEKPVDVINANLAGVKGCLDFLREQKETTGVSGRVVIFSSATVYGSADDHDISVTEDKSDKADVLSALNAPYSESKRMSEVMAYAYSRQYGVEAVVVRFSYVYGYSFVMPNTAFYQFINTTMSGNDIVMNNSGMGRRDNIFVEDAVEGLIKAAINGQSGEAYNISTNGELGNFSAIDEIAQIISSCSNKVCGVNTTVTAKNKAETRGAGLMMDNSKIKSLGWSVKTSLEDGILRTIEAYHDQK